VYRLPTLCTGRQLDLCTSATSIRVQAANSELARKNGEAILQAMKEVDQKFTSHSEGMAKVLIRVRVLEMWTQMKSGQGEQQRTRVRAVCY
jgi:DNA-binding protein H-NS